MSPQSTTTRPRLKDRYLTEIVPALKSELELGNVMQVPRLEKIVLNCGVGRAVPDPPGRRCACHAAASGR